LILQRDRDTPFDELPLPGAWDERHYGRNQLVIWVKESEPSPEAAQQP
jgi:hypothetical protein